MPAVADSDVGRDWRVMKPASAGFILLSIPRWSLTRLPATY
jgi:hypothetical protein